ncbi:hypothetical protein ACOMHN_024794 [Nucella lapillus]
MQDGDSACNLLGHLQRVMVWTSIFTRSPPGPPARRPVAPLAVFRVRTSHGLFFRQTRSQSSPSRGLVDRDMGFFTQRTERTTRRRTPRHLSHLPMLCGLGV